VKLWTGKDFLAQVPPKRLADVGRHEAAVRTIVEDVQRRGDAALLEYTARFDRAVLSPAELLISEVETAAAYEAVGLKHWQRLRRRKKISPLFTGGSCAATGSARRRTAVCLGRCTGR
jgi:histidinol dehydrogenase